MSHALMCDHPIMLKTAENDLELVILYLRLDRLTPWKEKIFYNCVQICKEEMNLETQHNHRNQRNQRKHHNYLIIKK